MNTLSIDPQMYGYAGVGHGGYVAGLLARLLPGATRVDLRAPTPLGKALTLQHSRDRARLLDGEVCIAEASATAFELDLPQPATRAEAQRASDLYAGKTRPHSMCFGCGPAREPGRGLRIFADSVPGRTGVAGLWTPDAAFADDAGTIKPEIVCAALDCPGGLAQGHLPARLDAVTAYLSFRLERPLPAEVPCLVSSWVIRRQDRKAWTGCALTDFDGRPYALSEALWIAPKLASQAR